MPWRGQPSIRSVLTTQSRPSTAGVPSLIEQPVETKVCLNRFTRLIDLSIYGHSSLPIVVAVSHPPLPGQPSREMMACKVHACHGGSKTNAPTPTHIHTPGRVDYCFSFSDPCLVLIVKKKKENAHGGSTDAQSIGESGIDYPSLHLGG